MDRSKSNSKKVNQLSLLQWNCRSIQNKTHVLANFLKEHFFHVLLLQSLNCSFFQLPKLDGYYYPPVCDTENGRVMTATYVSISITYTSFAIPVDSVDCRLSVCGVSIPSGKHCTKIVNVYYPSGSKESKQVDWIVNKINSEEASWIIGGDFNVSNRLWDSDAIIGEGEHLADTILNSYLTELNDGTFTRIGNKNQRNTAIDITLATNDLTTDFNWKTCDDSLFSDHLPILIDFKNNDKSDSPDINQSPKYKYKFANWDVFQALLKADCCNINPVDDNLNIYLQNLRTMILNAADIAIPKYSPKTHGKCRPTAEWWTHNCDDAISNKRKAMRNYQKIQSEENRKILFEKEKICKETLEHAKSKHWEDFCLSEVQSPADLSLLWKKIKSLQNNYHQPVKPLEINGHRTTSAFEKASVLAESFAKVSQSKNLSTSEKQFRHDEESKFLHPEPNNSADYNDDFLLSELITAINKLPNNEKATGNDPISNHMIRHLPESFLKMLLHFFQSCWTAGFVPDDWKEAVVVGIPKPGKPKHLPSSYRPIALTSHLSKLYERLVKSRLENMIEEHNILPLCQAGFRKNRSCIEHVVHLVEHAKRAISNKQTTVTTFFDIKRAFDSVWHAKLLNKLRCLGISGRLYEFVKSFLDNRRISVQVGSAMSPSYTLDMGVPQGSVVAPVLFSLMLHDIEQEIGKPGLFISLFADDLAIWLDCNSLSKKGKQLWLKKYQIIINSVQNYMMKNGFALSPEKTTLMVFTRNFLSRKDFHIYIDNQKITHSISTKFLGVVLHQNLSWDPHIQHLISKARRGVSVIKLLCGVTWVTKKSLIHLTQALVRSRLCYGHEATFTKTDNQWLCLERIELRALKAALGVSIYSINDLVYQNVGWLPLRDQCKLQTAKFQTKALDLSSSNNVQSVLTRDYSSNSDSHRQHLSERKPQVYRLTSPISSYTEDLFNQKLIHSVEEQSTIPTKPSWRRRHPTFDYQYGEKCTKKDNPNLISSLAKERLNMKYCNYSKIFTDGSILESGEIGCAFAIPDTNISKMYKLNQGVSIFSAELYAIYMACSYLQDLESPPKNVVILSDSKSVVEALSKGGTKTRRGLQNKLLNLIDNLLRKNINLTIMWIPSHVGIRGNEIVDKAAKTAATEGFYSEIGLSYSEKSKLLKTRIQTERERFLINRCRDHNWLFLPGFYNHVSNLPRAYEKVINRLQVESQANRFKPLLCTCGFPVSLQHCIDCTALPLMDSVRQLRNVHQLCCKDFLQPHSSLGNKPMRVLASAIINSNIKKWF
jgi:ribonuclease HI/exonuclease III